MGRGMDTAMTAALRGIYPTLLRRLCIGVQDKKVDLFVYRRARWLCFRKDQCGWFIMADSLRKEMDCLRCGTKMKKLSHVINTAFWTCGKCGVRVEITGDEYFYFTKRWRITKLPEGCLPIMARWRLK